MLLDQWPIEKAQFQFSGAKGTSTCSGKKLYVAHQKLKRKSCLRFYSLSGQCLSWEEFLKSEGHERKRLKRDFSSFQGLYEVNSLSGLNVMSSCPLMVKNEGSKVSQTPPGPIELRDTFSRASFKAYYLFRSLSESLLKTKAASAQESRSTKSMTVQNLHWPEVRALGMPQAPLRSYKANL